LARHETRSWGGRSTFGERKGAEIKMSHQALANS
jgi:hypothetical protein